jgi:hypothetical protein
MIRQCGGAVLLAVLGGCMTPPELGAHQVETASYKAKAAADLLFQRLSAELAAAMANGGAPAAVLVCKDRARAIASEIEIASGVDIERTALRVRNPANAPDAWEKGVMGSFIARRESGEEWSVMSAASVDGQDLRWMRPIPLGGTCVTCHGGGDAITPETRRALAEYYPDDEAVGFSAGELRGAFTARVPLP